MAFSIAFFIFMYKYLPLLATTELKRVNPIFGQQVMFNLVDGLIRIAMFLLFVWGVSLWKDIRRVYEYHGAEHKTVFAFENGDQLNSAEVQKYSTYHPRCGTSFLMTVMIISMLVYMAIPVHDFLGPLRNSHCSLAGDCWSLLRDHPIRRQASWFALCPDDRSRLVVAAHHHSASGRSRS